MSKITARKTAALLLSLALALCLLPATVLAEEAPQDVVYGYYNGDGVWVEGDLTQDLPEGVVSVNKTAEKKGTNEFDITLEVVTQQTITTVVDEAGPAATVLVMDISGSMDRCSECGNYNSHSSSCPYYNYILWDFLNLFNRIEASQTRIAAAKQVAASFINNFKGDGTTDRYIAIATFEYDADASSWFNVATEAGYNGAISYINSILEGGGTNMHDGLRKAGALLSDSTVAEISAKSAVVLSDGAPTYYIKDDGTVGGNGNDGSSTINTATAKAAADLKDLATIYTVCFGAKNDITYSGGPTVGNFLRDSIADSGNAYTADNAEELHVAFGTIVENILEGFTGSGASVVDENTAFVVPTVDDLFVYVTTDGFTWELTNPTETTEGGTTTYVYTLKYTVELDANNPDFEEGILYPLNGRTYLEMPDGEKIDFPIPAAEGTKIPYIVEFKLNYEGAIGGPADQNVRPGEKATEPTPAPEREGYTFLGWFDDNVEGDLYDFDTPVNANMTLFAQWEEVGVNEPEKIDYTVEHWLETAVDSDTYALGSTENLDADEGTTVTATPKTFEGYTYDSTNTNQVLSGELVNGGDEVVLKLYYTKDSTDVPEDPGDDTPGVEREDPPTDTNFEERPITPTLPATGSASTLYIAIILAAAGIAVAAFAKRFAAKGSK